MKTFTKIWLLLSVTLGTLYLAVLIFSPRSRTQSQSQSNDPSFDHRLEIHATNIESELLFSRTESLSSLVNEMEAGDSQVDNMLEEWLGNKPEIVSVAASIRDRARPLRVVQQGFWNDPIVLSASNDKRRRLLDFFLAIPDSPPAVGQGISTGPILSQDILGYPVMAVGIGFGPEDPIQRIVMTVDLRELKSILIQQTQNDDHSAVVDSFGTIVYASDSNLQLKGTPNSSSLAGRDGDRQFGLRAFSTLPWFLYYESRINVTRKSIDESQILPWMPLLGAIVLLGLIGSIILSGWVQRPLVRVARMATDIARGDFSSRVPAQKDKAVNKLAKLFNYMAEEMNHLQGLDVSEIINEKNKTETILRHIADGVVVTDPHDCVLVINRVAEKWFDLSEKKIFKKPLRDAINNKPLLDLLQDVKDGSLTSSGEFQFVLPGQRQQKIFQAHAARVQDPEDKLVGVVTVIRDVTKEKEADRIKTELVSMVAHELKSPLTSIYGFSELLLESPIEDPQTNEYAQVILNESSRLTDLVNKFLDLSRIEAGRTEIRMNPFDIRHVVEKIVDTYQKQAEQKEIRVITEIPKDLSIVMGDVDMIEQVLLNLFNNAIKYSPKRSKIGIEAKDAGDHVLVSVIDNGYGIPKEALPNIFDKFYRVAETEEIEEVEGSGLGLALAKAIVELHGGTISVNSRLGVGSVFTFTVPKIDTLIS